MPRSHLAWQCPVWQLSPARRCRRAPDTAHHGRRSTNGDATMLWLASSTSSGAITLGSKTPSGNGSQRPKRVGSRWVRRSCRCRSTHRPAWRLLARRRDHPARHTARRHPVRCRTIRRRPIRRAALRRQLGSPLLTLTHLPCTRLSSSNCARCHPSNRPRIRSWCTTATVIPTAQPQLSLRRSHCSRSEISCNIIPQLHGPIGHDPRTSERLSFVFGGATTRRATPKPLPKPLETCGAWREV